MKSASSIVPLPASAFAAVADPRMSARYVHIDTRDVVRLMGNEGWEVAAAKAASPRKRDPLYARHMIDFRRPGVEPIEGSVPRVIFVNSHNGTSSANAMAGFYRFVCENGLVIGTTVAKKTARHIFRDASEFVHEMQELATVAESHRETIYRWNEIDLSKSAREEYARLVGQLRWGDAYAYEPSELLTPRRAEDDSGSLLVTYNRAQENATRGGMNGVSRAGRRMVSQPISDINRDLNFNAMLWRLTEEFAEVHA